MSVTGIAAGLLAFALGGVLGGRLMGRLRGVDLRASGSGNVGATNALRTQGVRFALTVLLIDAGKGALAVLLLPQIAPDSPALPYYCGAMAVLGHCFSIWHGFDGGKGVATLAGVFLALMPETFLAMLAVFALLVVLTGIVSLATLFAALAAVFHVTCMTSAGLFSPAGGFVGVMTVLVLWTHRANWWRLARGEESRFEKARVLGRWLGMPPIGRG